MNYAKIYMRYSDDNSLQSSPAENERNRHFVPNIFKHIGLSLLKDHLAVMGCCCEQKRSLNRTSSLNVFSIKTHFRIHGKLIGERNAFLISISFLLKLSHF